MTFELSVPNAKHSQLHPVSALKKQTETPTMDLTSQFLQQ
jgi:hypothetical protein